MIRETTLPTFIETAQYTGQYIKHNVSPTPRVWFRTFDGGRAEIVFKGAEKPDKLRGPSKAGLWLMKRRSLSRMLSTSALHVVVIAA